MPKSRNWYERSDKETKEIVTGVALIVFVPILVFLLTNPIGAAVTFSILALGVFTISSKHKTWRLRA